MQEKSAANEPTTSPKFPRATMLHKTFAALTFICHLLFELENYSRAITKTKVV